MKNKFQTDLLNAPLNSVFLELLAVSNIKKILRKKLVTLKADLQ